MEPLCNFFLQSVQFHVHHVNRLQKQIMIMKSETTNNVHLFGTKNQRSHCFAETLDMCLNTIKFICHSSDG